MEITGQQMSTVNPYMMPYEEGSRSPRKCWKNTSLNHGQTSSGIEIVKSSRGIQVERNNEEPVVTDILQRVLKAMASE